MNRWPIRWRLTAWYGGVLAIVLTIFSIAVYATMRHQLLERIDSGLHEELSDVVGEVKRATETTGMLGWLERRFAYHEGFDFQITHTQGNRVFANLRLGERRLPVPDIRTTQGKQYRFATLDDTHRWRIVAERIAGPDGELIVQVARSLRDYDHEMSELLSVLLLVGPLTLVVALLGGYWLARRSLAPVDQMQSSAESITARRLNERLPVRNSQDELGRLAKTLNAMLDRLERTFREMQRFTADASHELRTPLAVIRTEAEIALQRDLSAESKQELLGTILEECQRLTWITDQLLTLSREDAGLSRLVDEPVNFSAVTQGVAENMRLLAEARQQRMSVDVAKGAMVSGDSVRLRHVVYNLLDNAIKYTPPEGSIELQLTLSGAEVQLTVRDSGIGIPAEHLPHVFERFYRVDKARSRAEGGAGLGLSIVQSIVQTHRGTVDLESEVDQGTSFTIRLPKRDESL